MKKKHSEEDIVELMKTKTWSRYAKTYLCKVMNPQSVIHTKPVHARYKFEESKDRPIGGSQLDPRSSKQIFTMDMKNAVENGMVSCEFITDIIPTEEKYRSATPSRKAKH